MQRNFSPTFYIPFLIISFLLAACSLESLGSEPELELETLAAESSADEPRLLESWNVLTSGVFGEVRSIDMMTYFPQEFEEGETLFLKGSSEGGMSGGSEDADEDQEDSDEIIRVGDAAKYGGWDLLTTPENPAFFGGVGEGENWLEGTLNRDAELGVVLGEDKNVPSWLGSWDEGENLELNGEGYRVFEKSFEAGEVTLPAPAPGTNYLLLLAEKGGEPSAEPNVPEGKEKPKPNQPCPEWVHNQYQAEGPNGRLYASWHPQLDPVYTCTFDHEHGSDPALLPGDQDVVFGYVADQLGQSESSEGFKNYIFEIEDGKMMMITLHAKLSNELHICRQFHTMKLKVVNSEGELEADLSFKADFGPSKDKEDGSLVQPSGCEEDQAAIAEEAPFAAKVIPDADAEGVEGLLSWQPFVGPGGNSGNALGLSMLSTVFYFENASLLPETGSDTKLVSTGEGGEQRYIIPIVDTVIAAASSVAGSDGKFCTDPYGNEQRGCDEDAAVEQYLKPGMQATWRGNILSSCTSDDAFQVAYTCDSNALEPLEKTISRNFGGDLDNN